MEWSKIAIHRCCVGVVAFQWVAEDSWELSRTSISGEVMRDSAAALRAASVVEVSLTVTCKPSVKLTEQGGRRGEERFADFALGGVDGDEGHVAGHGVFLTERARGVSGSGRTFSRLVSGLFVAVRWGPSASMSVLGRFDPKIPVLHHHSGVMQL